MSDPKKGIYASIYVQVDFDELKQSSNCDPKEFVSRASNNGISAHHREVFIPMTGKCALLPNRMNAPEVVIQPNSSHKDYIYAEPAEPVNREKYVGWMNGGAILVQPSESSIKEYECGQIAFHRKPFVNLHDRKETWAQYDMLSRKRAVTRDPVVTTKKGLVIRCPKHQKWNADLGVCVPKPNPSK